jgi:hypothetical protein
MRDFDALCLTSVEELSAQEIIAASTKSLNWFVLTMSGGIGKF